jgi:arabinofuranosyltransferase
VVAVFGLCVCAALGLVAALTARRLLPPRALLWTALAAGALLALRLSWVPDDTYISMRYAANLADGRGLVFNEGERVEGYTNFLWTVALALPRVAGIGMRDFAVALSGAAFLATIAATHRLGRRLVGDGPDAAAPVAPLLVALSVPVFHAGGSGLETAAFGLCVTSGTLLLACHVKTEDARRVRWAALWFAVAALLRPEGIFHAGVAFAAAAFAARARPGELRRCAAALAAVAVVVAAHVAWRWSYYGDVVPNTFHAKVGFTVAQAGHGAKQAIDFVTHGGWLVLVPVAAAPYLARRSPWTIPCIATAAATFAYVTLVGGDSLFLHRFFVPAIPCALVAAEETVRCAAPSLGAWLRTRTGAAAAFLFPVALWAATFDVTDWRLDVKRWRGVEDAAATIGAWLDTNAPQGASIAVEAAGAIPWHAPRVSVIDMYGLMDRRIAAVDPSAPMGSRKAGHEKFDPAYVLSRRPTYVYLGRPTSWQAPADDAAQRQAVLELVERLPGATEKERAILRVEYDLRVIGDGEDARFAMFVRR